MSTPTLPNAERLLSAFWRQDADVVASALSDHVFTDLPAGWSTWPAARVTRIGGAPLFTVPHVIDEPLMQVDVWGGPKSTTYDVAAVLRGSLVAATRLPFAVPGAGVLSCVERFGALRYVPDVTWDPARPRYLFDVVVQTRTG